MQNLIEFITGGATEFTPQAVIGVIVFVLIFDGIMCLTGELVGMARGRK